MSIDYNIDVQYERRMLQTKAAPKLHVSLNMAAILDNSVAAGVASQLLQALNFSGGDRVAALLF